MPGPPSIKYYNMNQKILKLAVTKFKKLRKKYDGFINVFVDDWRGYRFVFDTKDVRKCNNDCLNCPLFKLLEDEKTDVFSSDLYPANTEDKALFGPQNFLNCKTLKQYQNCYINYLSKRCKSKKEINKELSLVKNLRIIFSKEGNASEVEQRFKRKIIEKFSW
jgi:hypothetical protein